MPEGMQLPLLRGEDDGGFRGDQPDRVGISDDRIRVFAASVEARDVG